MNILILVTCFSDKKGVKFLQTVSVQVVVSTLQCLTWSTALFKIVFLARNLLKLVGFYYHE